MVVKPRIAFIHNVVIHYRVPLFNLLAARGGWEIHFYFGGVHPWMYRLVHVNDDYRIRFNHFVLKGLHLVEFNYFSPSLAFQLIRGQYDVFVGSSLANPDCLIAFLVSRLLRRPFMLWDERWQSSGSFLNRLAEPIQFLITRMAECVVVPGSKSYEYFSNVLGNRIGKRASSFFSGKGGLRLLIAPNASVVKKPSSSSVQRFRHLYGIPSKKKVILYLGRLVATKGVDHLLRAFAMLEKEFQDKVFLLIAGEGEEREKLQKLAETLDIRNIKFTCSYVYEQAACLSVADVVVLPSIAIGKHSETWGLVVNEAISLGKPVVVTEEVGCADDIVRRFECGYTVRDGDSLELYNAIRSILFNPELGQRISENGIRATRELFNYGTMADAFYHAIRQVLIGASAR